MATQDIGLDLKKMSADRSTLRYPADMAIASDTDYIQFDFFEYAPPMLTKGSGLNKQTVEDLTNTESLSNVLSGNIGKGINDFRAGVGYNQLKTKIDGEDNEIDGNFSRRAIQHNHSTGKKQQIPSIQLYMPQDVSTSFAASWGGKEFGSAAAGILGAIGGNAENAIIEGIKSIPAGMVGLTSDLMSKMLSGANQQLSQNDVLGSTSAVIKNPMVELLFGGPKTRNIGFKFKMSARDEQEAEQIHQICHIFKMELLPSFGNAQGDGKNASGSSKFTNFIKIPDLVRMKLMNGVRLHPYLSQYKGLALTNVDINYTPDGSYSTYMGGYPSAVELSIQMVETKIVYKEDLQQDRNWSY